MTSRRFPVFSRGISTRGTIKASVPSVGKAISFTGTPVPTLGKMWGSSAI
ncbi:hypothetical protein ACU4HD_31840 [Cupriavidus basilensis]